MMKARRYSLGWLMTIILLIAVDFAAVKDAYARANWPYPVLLVTTLPMANVMFLVAPRLRPGRAGRPFWIAFEAVGVLLIALSVYLDLNYKGEFLAPFRWLHEVTHYPVRSTARSVVSIAFTLVVYTPPQFLAAGLAGWLASALAKRRSVLPE